MPHKITHKSFESLIHAKPEINVGAQQKAVKRWIELTKPAQTSSYAEVPVNKTAHQNPAPRRIPALWRKDD